MREDNKLIKVLVFIILIIFIGLISYLIYNKIVTDKSESSSTASFYDINNLTDKKYLCEVNSKEENFYYDEEPMDAKNKAIRIENEKVFVPEDLSNIGSKITIKEAQGIEGIPDSVYYGYYQTLDTSVFLVLTKEGDVYYSNVVLNNNKKEVNKFKKINNEKIKKLYKFCHEEGLVYPTGTLSIYALTNSKELKQIKNGKMTSLFKDDYKYPDVIPTGFDTSNPLKQIFISSDQRPYYAEKTNNTYTYKEIKYNNLVIKVKDGFSKEENDKVEYYIIDTDNNLYKMDSNTKQVTKYESKIKSYKYQTSSDYNGVDIVFLNGQNMVKEKIYITTLYYRNK